MVKCPKCGRSDLIDRQYIKYDKNYLKKREKETREPVYEGICIHCYDDMQKWFKGKYLNKFIEDFWNNRVDKKDRNKKKLWVAISRQ